MINASFRAVAEELQNRNHREGSARTVKATIEASGQVICAAIKTSPPKRMASEFTAQVVASILNVPCAETYFVRIDEAAAQNNDLVGGLKITDGVRLLFGSKFSSLPQAPVVTLGQLPLWYSQTLVFDILVGNVDRAAKNVLGDATKWLLIDHDQIFLSRDWTADHLRVNPLRRVSNAIDNDITLVCPTMDAPEIQAILDIAKRWSGAITRNALEPLSELKNLNLIDEDELNSITDFLLARGSNLVKLTHDTLHDQF